MKTFFVILFALMGLDAQSRFVFMGHKPGPDPSTIALGTVQEEPTHWHFISEDGKVEYRYPRLDLAKPSVKVISSGDVYTYVVTNAPDAKANIDVIRLLPGINPEGTEVLTPQGFIFTDAGWMVSQNAPGIQPGHSAVFKIRQRRVSAAMEIINVPTVASLTELPYNMPYGMLVLFNEWMADHRGVKISDIKPTRK